MRIADLDFVLVPEWLARPGQAAPDDDHWISRWQRNIATARWLDVAGPGTPDALVVQCAANARPTIVVTHGHAVDVLLDSGARLNDTTAIGAFIVAPVPDAHWLAEPTGGQPSLPVPSLVIASDNHPELSARAAQRFASRLGSQYVAGGELGRIDAGSGQGPWPDGLLRLGRFLKHLARH